MPRYPQPHPGADPAGRGRWLCGLMTATALPAPGPPPLRRGQKEGVLVSLRSARAAATAWEVEAARLVTEWVAGHSLAERLTAASGPLAEQVIELDDGVVRPSLPGLQSPMRLAGPGAPLVSDLAFCELATTLSMSLDAARGYVGEVTELGYRLPALWQRVCCGEVRLWRAREVARSTGRLPADGAAWVDAQLAPVIGSCSGAQLLRTVTAALHRYDPESAEAERRAAANGQHFDVHLGDMADPAHPGSSGVVAVDGLLDAADALDLEAAVAARAAQLGNCGSDEGLGVRRARALGEFARRDQTLPIPAAPDSSGAVSGTQAATVAAASTSGSADGDGSCSPRAEGDQHAFRTRTMPAGAPGAAPGRRIQLILHLNADALSTTGAVGGLGRCANTRTPVSAEQIRTWCSSPDARVTVLPVIDLAGHYPTESYEVPARVRSQVIARDPQCVFPSCTRNGRSADLDHIVPFDEGGPTCGCNLAPLCRRHHRAKTHSGWTYVMVTPGTYLWFSPSGDRYLVEGRGTFRVPAIGEVYAHSGAQSRPEPPPWPKPLITGPPGQDSAGPPGQDDAGPPGQDEAGDSAAPSDPGSDPPF